MKNLFLVLVLAAGISFSGCSKKAQQAPGDEALPTATSADENTSGDSDNGGAGGLRSINFPYDAFVLDETAKGILKANAQVLKDKGSMNIQVEGHCDSRGGIQYNLGLGEKRANVVKKYLAEQGIAKARIKTISFGKEKLLDQADSEDAHAKNRRANFVITSK